MRWIYKPALESISSTDEVEVPDVYSPEYSKDLQKVVEEFGKDSYILAGLAGPFVGGMALRKTTNLLLDFYRNPRMLERLLDRWTDYMIEAGKACIRAGSDGVRVCDDLAGNQGTLVSPHILRRFIFPREKRMVEALKREDVHVIYHTCGDVTDILEDLVKVGMDGLEDIDSLAGMDIGQVKEWIGNKVCLIGNPLFPLDFREDPEQVRRECLACIKKAAYSGGYILSPIADINRSTSVKNVVAMVKTVKRYGKYPIWFVQDCGLRI